MKWTSSHAVPRRKSSLVQLERVDAAERIKIAAFCGQSKPSIFLGRRTCSLVTMLTELYKLANKQAKGTRTIDYSLNDASKYRPIGIPVNCSVERANVLIILGVSYLAVFKPHCNIS